MREGLQEFTRRPQQQQQNKRALMWVLSRDVVAVKGGLKLAISRFLQTCFAPSVNSSMLNSLSK